MGAFSVILWAYEYGPDPGVCGVPGEHGTCTTQAGCHSGTTNNPANKGSITVSFPNGLNYVPGVAQHLTVTVADPAPTQAAWGFELTARPSSSSSTMAGSFVPDDAYTQIMCAKPNLDFIEVVCLPGAGQQGCTVQSATPACPAGSLQYMEHSYAGYTHTMGQGSGTYQFDWTPPASSVGNVVLYVAANAGVAGPPNKDNDHIYSTSYTLTPGTASNAPVIASGGVVSNATGLAGISPNLYVNINGTNLSTATDVWDTFISNGNLPTKIDGVTVTIGGKAAYIQYVSPTRIQVLTPPDLGTGSVNVQVNNANGNSNTVVVTSSTYAPGFFQWNNNQPVATHADFTDAMKNQTYPGFTTVPAKPGEYIILWGTGFGPTNPAAPSGTLVPNNGTPYYVTAVPALTVNNLPMTYYATALAPNFAGLYQAVAQVPSTLANGDWPIIATVGGISSATGIVLTVHN
jgi:uncharacterized protein (TIGR03437 family)